MQRMTMKNWFDHVHLPDRHGIAMWGSHILHSERFWAIVVMLVLLGMMLGLAIWAGVSGSGSNSGPVLPYRPFVY